MGGIRIPIAALTGKLAEAVAKATGGAIAGAPAKPAEPKPPTLRKLTPEQAWLRAASWGSYMRSGDPGACMYGFHETGRPQSEAHRADCLAYILDAQADVLTRPELYEPGDATELQELAEYLKTAPLEEPAPRVGDPGVFGERTRPPKPAG